MSFLHKAPAYRWIVLGTLCVVYVCNFLDRQLMSILAEPMKQELRLSDTDIGLLTGSMFAIFYTVFGVPVGLLADRTHRVRVLAASCMLWSAFSAACGVSSNFAQLAAARMGVGVGEAGGAPPSYSIISDYYATSERGLALAIFSLGVPLGIALGSAFGAAIADSYGWRTAFLAVGAFGVALALLVLLVVREPVRGSMDGERRTVSVTRLSEIVRAFFSVPVLRMTAIAGGLSAFVYYGMLNWTVPFLLREKGITMREVAVYYSTMLAVSMGAGMCLSGWIVDRLSQLRRDAYGLVPALAFLIAIPCYVAFLHAPGWPVALACLAVPSFCNVMFLAPALTVVQNATPAAWRTTASAILLFVINLVGLGLGPLFVGTISDLAAPVYGQRSLMVAMLCLVPFCLLAAGAHLLTARALVAQPGVGRLVAQSAGGG